MLAPQTQVWLSESDPALMKSVGSYWMANKRRTGSPFPLLFASSEAFFSSVFHVPSTDLLPSEAPWLSCTSRLHVSFAGRKAQAACGILMAQNRQRGLLSICLQAEGNLHTAASACCVPARREQLPWVSITAREAWRGTSQSWGKALSAAECSTQSSQTVNGTFCFQSVGCFGSAAQCAALLPARCRALLAPWCTALLAASRSSPSAGTPGDEASYCCTRARHLMFVSPHIAAWAFSNEWKGGKGT